jgi:hypothetical protein
MVAVLWNEWCVYVHMYVRTYLCMYVCMYVCYVKVNVLSFIGQSILPCNVSLLYKIMLLHSYCSVISSLIHWFTTLDSLQVCINKELVCFHFPSFVCFLLPCVCSRKHLNIYSEFLSGCTVMCEYGSRASGCSSNCKMKKQKNMCLMYSLQLTPKTQ